MKARRLKSLRLSEGLTENPQEEIGGRGVDQKSQDDDARYLDQYLQGERPKCVEASIQFFVRFHLENTSIPHPS